LRRFGSFKGVFVVAVWLSCWIEAGGSTVLLRGDRRTPREPDTVITFGGAATFTPSVVRPASSVTVVWMMDLFDAGFLDQARNDILSMARRLPGRPLRLVVLRGTQTEAFGPFLGSVRLEQVLRKIELTEADAGGEAQARNSLSPAAPFDGLIQSVDALGAQWSAVVLMGKLPDLSTETRLYATALLTRIFAAHKLRTFIYDPANDAAEWNAFCDATGAAVVRDFADLPRMLDERVQAFLEINWEPARAPGGFVLFPATLADDHSATIISLTDIADQGSPLPSIASFAGQQALIQEASEMFHAPFSDKTLNDVRDQLMRAGEMNPVDPRLLRLEALFCEQTHTSAEGVRAAVLLAQVRPTEGASYSLLGHLERLASDYDKAEKALNRAGELGIPSQQLAEDRARVYLGRKDDAGALPYLKVALDADNSRQDLWFLQAQSAERAHQPQLAMASFEKGLARGGVHTPESAALIHLYLANQQRQRAHEFALHSIEALPADVETRAAFAQTLEEAKLSDEALTAWRSVIAVRNDIEMPHVRVAKLLLETGNAKESVEAATTDLTVFPKSADLYLVKADALRQLGMEYESRGTLEEGAATTGAIPLLLRFAEGQESFGYGAAEAYEKLGDAVEPGSAQRIAALERGCFVALRDGDLKEAQAFAAKLKAEGRDDCRALVGQDRVIAHDLLVPGGRDALAFIANGKKGVPPDKFLSEFANTVVANACKGVCREDEFKPKIQKYFDTVAQLEAMGNRKGDRVSIEVSLKGKPERKHAQEFLHLLGIDLHNQGGTVKLDMGAGQSHAKKQEIMSALAVDEVGLEQALQSGQSYTIEIVDDPVAMYPSAKLWQDSFPAYVKSGFLESMLQSPRLARLYAAISAIDRNTLQGLFSAVHLRDFSDQSIELLTAYGSCFAIQDSSASVPGGSAAKALWGELAGVSPDRAGEFYRALLQPSNATLLAFFYELSQLDPPHQEFVTENLERTRRFYFLFEHMPGSQSAGRTFNRDMSLAELLGSVPLDSEGHLAFPGSPEVWSVAKGRDADKGRITKLMKKVSKTAAPDVEDAILLRLAETRYKEKETRHTELDNFLSVSHVDAHRSEPLDEESALLLAQRYADYWAAYTYFADISAINLDGFRSFFDLTERSLQQPLLEQNLELGQLHSLLEWVSILRRRNRISANEASRLFMEICRRLEGADDAAARAQSTLDLARAILKECGKGAPANADETLRSCLLGARTEGPAGPRNKDYGLVMDAQKVPSLAALFAIDDALVDLLKHSEAGKPTILDAQKIAQIASALPLVNIPKHQTATNKEREAILLYSPEEVQKRADELIQKAQKRKPNPNAAQKLANELLRAMEPQVTLALAGPVYAYFLRSSDLVIEEDALLLRKHRYFDFLSENQHRSPIQESEFVPRNESVGSYFVGGFAQFGMAAGRAAATGWRHGGPGGDRMIAAQITAIRSTPWDLLSESDQRLVSLRILVAREWIVAAAKNEATLQGLSKATTGLLSLSRRAALLSGVRERDWAQVWASISLPDLFMLGSRLPQNPGEALSHSRGWEELRRVSAANDGSRTNQFGRVPYQVLGCAHPHIAPDSPYEEYERRMPDEIAERTADLKLFLAYRADSLGVTPFEVGRIVEQIAAKAFQSSQIADYRDWQSLLAAYSEIENKQILGALEQ
jgi:Flp pilus assembly protein TadD